MLRHAVFVLLALSLHAVRADVVALSVKTLPLPAGFVVRGVAALPTLATAGGALQTTIFFSSISVSNATVNVVLASGNPADTLSLSAPQRLAGQPGMLGCWQARDTYPPNASYPLAPLGLSIGSNETALLFADRLPSSRVMELQRAEQGWLAAPAAAVQIVAGTSCNYSEATLPSSGRVPAATTAIASPSHVLEFNGVVYFTQRDSVATRTPDGTVGSFFGSDSNPASYTDTFNSREQLLSNATTSAPAQMVVDEVNNVMYVAEAGLGTVRAINLSSGVASVVVGSVTGEQPFPPVPCTAASPCAARSVAMLRPSGLALYRPTQTARGELWLFVADASVGVVYRVRIGSNGAAALQNPDATLPTDVVAGRALFSGRVDGPLGTSRVMAVSQMVALPGRNALLLVDGALRVLTLDDIPVPPPPFVPTSVVTGTQTAVAIASVTVSTVSPTTAVQATRVALLLSLAQCKRDFGDELDVTTNVLQLAIGSGEFRYFVGAVIGNLAVCLGFVALHAAGALVYSRAVGVSFVRACAAVRFPSLVAFPLLFVLEGTTASALTLVFYTGSALAALGVLGAIVCLSTVAALAWYFFRVFQVTFVVAQPRRVAMAAAAIGNDSMSGGSSSSDDVRGHTVARFYATLVKPVGHWENTSGNRWARQRMGMFFEDYVPERWWFCLVELAMCVLTGVIDASHPEGFETCLSVVVFASLLYTAFFLALLLLKPFTVRINYYISAAVAFLQAVSSAELLIYVGTGDSDWARASGALALASLYVTLGRSAFDLLSIARSVLRHFKDRAVARRHQRPSVVDRRGHLELAEVTLLRSSDDSDGDAEKEEHLQKRVADDAAAAAVSREGLIVVVTSSKPSTPRPSPRLGPSAADDDDEISLPSADAPRRTEDPYFVEAESASATMGGLAGALPPLPFGEATHERMRREIRSMLTKKEFSDASSTEL